MEKYGKYAGIFIFNLEYMEQLHPASMNCLLETDVGIL